MRRWIPACRPLSMRCSIRARAARAAASAILTRRACCERRNDAKRHPGLPPPFPSPATGGGQGGGSAPLIRDRNGHFTRKHDIEIEEGTTMATKKKAKGAKQRAAAKKSARKVVKLAAKR